MLFFLDLEKNDTCIQTLEKVITRKTFHLKCFHLDFLLLLRNLPHSQQIIKKFVILKQRRKHNVFNHSKQKFMHTLSLDCIKQQ